MHTIYIHNYDAKCVYNVDWFRFSLMTCHMSIYETTARPSFRPLCISNARNRAVDIIRPLFFVFETVPINCVHIVLCKPTIPGQGHIVEGLILTSPLKTWCVWHDLYEGNTWLNQIFFNSLHVLYYSCAQEILGIH